MKAKEILEQMERCRDAIGKERDKLRDLEIELENLTSSIDEGYDSLESAISEFRGAIDELSEEM
jgi:chromosome segregation ATPase